MNDVREQIAETLGQRVDEARSLYHRLVLLVGPMGSGKTAVLRQTAGDERYPYLNLNLEMSRRMLELTERQRALRANTLLAEIAEGTGGNPFLMDNIEVLFDRSLQQDPLRLLKDLSRQRTVVAAWNGTIDASGLTYAEPEHQEYRRYSASEIDFLSVTMEGVKI